MKCDSVKCIVIFTGRVQSHKTSSYIRYNSIIISQETKLILAWLIQAIIESQDYQIYIDQWRISFTCASTLIRLGPTKCMTTKMMKIQTFYHTGSNIAEKGRQMKMV